MSTPTHILKNTLFYTVFDTINPKSDGSNTISRHDVTGESLYVYLFYNQPSWERKDIDFLFCHSGTLTRHNHSQSRRKGNIE